MEPTDWRRRAHDFLFGDYQGAPVAYLMALAIDLAMMLVIAINLVGHVAPDYGRLLLEAVHFMRLL